MTWNTHKKLLLTGLNTAPALDSYLFEPTPEPEWDPAVRADQVSIDNTSYKKPLFLSFGLAILVHLILFLLWSRVGLSEAVSSVTPPLMTFTFSFENAEPLPMTSETPLAAPVKTAANPLRKLVRTVTMPSRPEPQPAETGENPAAAQELLTASVDSTALQIQETETNQGSGTPSAAPALTDIPSNGAFPTPAVYQASYHNSPEHTSAPLINASRRSSLSPALEYPALAVRRGYEGTVLIHLEIDRQGKVTEVHLLQSSGYDVLDQAVLKSARNWLYKPARKGNENVADSAQARIRFRLNEPVGVD